MVLYVFDICENISRDLERFFKFNREIKKFRNCERLFWVSGSRFSLYEKPSYIIFLLLAKLQTCFPSLPLLILFEDFSNLSQNLKTFLQSKTYS